MTFCKHCHRVLNDSDADARGLCVDVACQASARPVSSGGIKEIPIPLDGTTTKDDAK